MLARILRRVLPRGLSGPKFRAEMWPSAPRISILGRDLRAMRGLASKAAYGLVAAVLGIAAAPSPAAAHPHMFFDAQAVFVVDDAQRLTTLHVAFVIDDLNSLLIVSHLSLDPDGDGATTPDENAYLAELFAINSKEYGFYTDLRFNGDRVDWEVPSETIAWLDQGRIAARFTFTLPEPAALTEGLAALKLYDPTYYTEVRMIAPPDLIADSGAEACSVSFTAFDTMSPFGETQMLLSLLAEDVYLEDANVGEQLSDLADVTCLN